MACAPARAVTLFQFTLPRGERPKRVYLPHKRACFNSRSRVGSDEKQAKKAQREKVSIHAPAWGATRRCRNDHLLSMVSIHAPAWGATMKAFWFLFISRFQFTLPRGERQKVLGSAPLSSVFQFTLPRGERPQRLIAYEGQVRFQFTLPRGERPENEAMFDERLRVSIHAPAWGATQYHPFWS